MKTRRKRNAPVAGLRRHARPRATAGWLLERMAALTTLVAGPLAERSGLGAAEWRVVAALGDTAALSLAETASRAAVESGRAARALQALARAGYVERTHDAFDARRSLFRLGRRGRALYRRVTLRARARERALLAALAPVERRQLDRLLAKLQRTAAGGGD